MRRYDARMKAATTLTDAEKEEYYYRKTLGVPNPATASLGGTGGDVSTAMGRKSAVLDHAYEFALRQYEVLQKNDGMTEEESIEAVEELLAKEEQAERLVSREKVRTLMKEREILQQQEATTNVNANATDKANQNASAGTGTDSEAAATQPPSFTVPSILHSKPRTIQALNIWGKRLQAVPYNQWTLGASTALDHWIAVDVLGMAEDTWNRLLDGELEVDLERSRGGDVNVGDKARTRDIATVRSTLFPETVLSRMRDDDDEEDGFGLDGGDEEDFSLDEEKDATERSIDELLASLGGFEDQEKDGNSDVLDAASSSIDLDTDARVSSMIDSLQDWRAKNQEVPFKEWDADTKKNFDVSFLFILFSEVWHSVFYSLNLGSMNQLLIENDKISFNFPLSMRMKSRNGSMNT